MCCHNNYVWHSLWHCMTIIPWHCVPSQWLYVTLTVRFFFFQMTMCFPNDPLFPSPWPFNEFMCPHNAFVYFHDSYDILNDPVWPSNGWVMLTMCPQNESMWISWWLWSSQWLSLFPNTLCNLLFFPTFPHNDFVLPDNDSDLKHGFVCVLSELCALVMAMLYSWCLSLPLTMILCLVKYFLSFNTEVMSRSIGWQVCVLDATDRWIILLGNWDY